MDPVIASLNIRQALADGPRNEKAILEFYEAKKYFQFGDSCRKQIGLIICDVLLKKQEKYVSAFYRL